MKNKSRRWENVAILIAIFACLSLPAFADSPKIGVVIMHGKGGMPGKFVNSLAAALEDKGYLVANIEMPWSRKREYDADTGRAEQEIEAALARLRGKGAQKVFVAGHSMGGAFGLHFVGKHTIDGLVAIAPGGDVSGRFYSEKVAPAVARARQLVADGKGDQKIALDDFENAKGVYPIVTTPAIYLTWFDPDSAMNMQRAARSANPAIPILWIVAKNDYPGLRRANIPMFNTFPSNPQTKLYEPNSDHIGAPSASIEEIVRWTTEVAGKR